jgi:hypothetical protein
MSNLNLKNRVSLIYSLPRGGVFAEVGVLRGDFSLTILAGNRPNKLYLIDSWQEQPGTVWQQKDSSAKADHDRNYQLTLSRFACDERVRIIKEFSTTAAQRFADETLDKVYIDADHTKAAEDIAAWWVKLRHGGWLCGHDYTHMQWSNVKPDVDKFVADNNLTLFLTQEYPKDWPSWAIQKP